MLDGATDLSAECLVKAKNGATAEPTVYVRKYATLNNVAAKLYVYGFDAPANNNAISFRLIQRTWTWDASTSNDFLRYDYIHEFRYVYKTNGAIATSTFLEVFA